MLQLNAYAVDAETPLDLLTSYLTPNDLFFVRHHWQPPAPLGPKTWRLAVDGEVAKPLSLSLAELKRLPATSVTCVLQCAGNGRSLQAPRVPGIQWGQGAVGNARWTGVRLKDLLERTGLESSARHLHTFGADAPPTKVPPFHRSLELEKARDDALLAYAMNGEPLSALHGAPVRLVVPGWAGDHWMKWVTRISARAEPQRGFFMDVAYRYPKAPGAPGVTFPPEQTSPVTELFVKSTFTEVPSQTRPGSTLTLRGFAFSGAPDIAKVEVSEDDGASWMPATLDPRHDPYAWRLWTFRWTPERSGHARLVVRATDSRGTVQPREPVWNQSGYLSNGWHAVEVEVTNAAAPPRIAERNLPAVGAGTPRLPEGAGRSVAEQSCLGCHSADVLRQQRLTERQWTASIAKMKGWGAELSEEESARLLTYLTEHFGSGNDSYRPVLTRPIGR
jgi:sulfite oxidase